MSKRVFDKHISKTLFEILTINAFRVVIIEILSNQQENLSFANFSGFLFEKRIDLD